MLKQAPNSNLFRQSLALMLIIVLQFSTAVPVIAQLKVSGPIAGGKATANKKQASKKSTRGKDGKSDSEIVAERVTAESSGMKSTAEIMAEQASRGIYKTPREIFRESGVKRKKERPDRSNLPQNPDAQALSRLPHSLEDELSTPELAPQPVGLNFDTVTGPADTGAFPPDTMGAVGPTQFFVFLNGRLRTFNKTTGLADGAVNVDSDVFFASVMTPPIAGETVFSTDPNVRFDRLSNRWFLNIIDAPVIAATGALSRPNRLLIAVSDAASNGTISGTTVWTFYQFQGDAALFTDYQSFGVDASAMYIGANMFTIAGAFNSTKGFVIPKAPALTASPLTVWAFSGLASGAGAGPFSPRGVDNYAPGNTGPTAEGYFIGVDNATFSTLMMRRITNPGSLGPAPTISANISITTPTTTTAISVDHLGDTGGAGGNLDSLDDRLYAAHIRNGRLWTAHSFTTNAAGAANAGATRRMAVRWYELIVPPTTGTPTINQSGTVFDNAATQATARQYWLPSVMVSGQGHAAIGYSTAGTPFRADAATNGRLVGNTLGTTGAVNIYTTSSTAYNPPGDPGPTRRWGDYSYTSLDPQDDMTMWTIQQYTNGTNTYGTRVAQLRAPAPPAIANGPQTGGLYNVPAGFPSVNVVITGTPVAGEGFYDPGPNPAAPHTPFNHIAATVANSTVTVNSVTYNSATQVTLNLNTVGAAAGTRDLTITNPDGQQIVRNDVINIVVPTAAPANIGGRIVDAYGRGIGNVRLQISSPDGSVSMRATTNSFGYYRFEDVMTGVSLSITPTHKRFLFDPESHIFVHTDEITNLDFSGLAPKQR